MEASPTVAPLRLSVGGTVRDVGWRMLVGASAGVVAGFVVGGVGGRLAMLLLRLTSPETVVGVISDDGFEIGVVSLETVNLLGATTAAGCVVGALYAAARGAIPPRLRVPLWTLAWGLLAAGALVSQDGVDFTLLEPTLLAIALFVALPAGGAALMAVLAERLSGWEPWRGTRRIVLLLAAAAAGNLGALVALVVSAVVLAVVLVLDELRPSHRAIVRRVALVMVPLVLVALAVLGALDVVADTRALL